MLILTRKSGQMLTIHPQGTLNLATPIGELFRAGPIGDREPHRRRQGADRHQCPPGPAHRAQRAGDGRGVGGRCHAWSARRITKGDHWDIGECLASSHYGWFD